MTYLPLILIILAILILLIVAIAYICYFMAFHVPKTAAPEGEEINLPKGAIYEPYWEQMTKWLQETKATPCEEMSITSFDGLMLRGRYYEYSKKAPIELMFHGYRGAADRDLCGAVQRCFLLGHNALLVDQRACGQSDGHIITFGVKERRDCQSWVNHIIAHFGEDVKIILTGISMGAATVTMAAGEPLPKNVIGVLADCGYTSAKDIIQRVVRQMKLPPKLSYPFVRLGAKLFAHFDLEEFPPIEAVKHCKLPILFIHGENDNFVPCEMSRKNYEACTAKKKKLFTVPLAGHGLSYLLDTDGYMQTVQDFFRES